MKKESSYRGIHRRFLEDSTKRDQFIFDRKSNRRGFLTDIVRMSTLIGAPIAYSQLTPTGLISAAFATTDKSFNIPGKHPGLILLNDKPINAETPAHLLDAALTPSDLFFVRNNGIPPQVPDSKNWTLTIDGESAVSHKKYSISELQKRFENVSYELTLECGGNGRSEFSPPAKGNQWTTGAVGCAKWTGIRLADVLNDAGIKDDAVYIGYTGADSHLSLDPSKRAISRGVPIAKALKNESMIAWAMNDEPLPLMNGYPLRLVFGGWPASTSGKWLTNIHIRNRVHDGEKMGGKSYRIPCNPVAPGAKVADSDMCIIHEMPVKSLITFPKSGIIHSIKDPLNIRGHAWAGDLSVKKVAVSIDFGQTWQPTTLTKATNLNAWQHFDSKINFTKKGYFEIWARATDTAGRSQPMLIPGWNPKGYLNNACHRIAVKVV